jgi:hypothetical protein
MAGRVSCIGINALYMVHNLPVLGRRLEYLVRAELNLRLRLRRSSSTDYTKRYAARGMVCMNACCRQALLKDLSCMAIVDEILL